MISAELIHNPYLLSTSVRFNKQSPRINSQIEKYEHQPLKDWVELVPSIFYNEMNGYDFDFLFTGTVSDFEEVKKAFQRAGVSENEVRLIHKNEIEDVDIKSKEIDALLLWLSEQANRKFDYNTFWDENADLFESPYSYIVIGNHASSTQIENISMESIEDARELKGTDLSSTPIVFYIGSESAVLIRKNISAILERKDVRQEQLFFMISSKLNADQVTRTITDLGVARPQVVNDFFDESIQNYIRNYPMTEYVREAIKVFREVVGKIEPVLNSENEASLIANAEIHKKIDGLEDEITVLKNTDVFFAQRDNYVVPTGFAQAQESLKEQILKWKNRKTKIVGEYEIDQAAIEYENYVQKIIKQFQDTILGVFQNAANSITNDFYVVYANAGIDIEYRADISFKELCDLEMLKIADELCKIKEETWEEAKSDFFGLFKKPTDNESKPVRIVTCYLEKWRDKVVEMIMPLAEKKILEASQILENGYNSQAEEYHSHLCQLISGKISEKDLVASSLSDDELKLQQDNDWLSVFADQLVTIERN